MNHPYRISSAQLIIVPRWGVSWQRKLLVRLARRFINLRAKYIATRLYAQYLRNRETYKTKYFTYLMTCKYYNSIMMRGGVPPTEDFPTAPVAPHNPICDVCKFNTGELVLHDRSTHKLKSI